MQERCNSIANALELHLSCTEPTDMWYDKLYLTSSRTSKIDLEIWKTYASGYHLIQRGSSYHNLTNHRRGWALYIESEPPKICSNIHICTVQCHKNIMNFLENPFVRTNADLCDVVMPKSLQSSMDYHVVPGLYSISGRRMSKRLNVIMITLLWNLTGISPALLLRCLSNFRVTGKSKPQSYSFKTSWVLTVRIRPLIVNRGPGPCCNDSPLYKQRNFHWEKMLFRWITASYLSSTCLWPWLTLTLHCPHYSVHSAHCLHSRSQIPLSVAGWPWWDGPHDRPSPPGGETRQCNLTRTIFFLIN